MVNYPLRCHTIILLIDFNLVDVLTNQQSTNYNNSPLIFSATYMYIHVYVWYEASSTAFEPHNFIMEMYATVYTSHVHYALLLGLTEDWQMLRRKATTISSSSALEIRLQCGWKQESR